jgi:hypothetical protein
MAQATLILIMFRSNPKIFRVSGLYHGYGSSSIGAGSPKVFVQQAENEFLLGELALMLITQYGKNWGCL